MDDIDLLRGVLDKTGDPMEFHCGDDAEAQFRTAAATVVDGHITTGTHGVHGPPTLNLPAAVENDRRRVAIHCGAMAW